MDIPDNGIPGLTIRQRCAINNKTLEQCIEFIAVHEFGHVLGLSHEQNRNDDGLPSPCKTDNSADENVHGNTYFTDYDPNSIMNYCRQNYYGDSSLSKTDALAVKVYYGRIPTFIAETLKLELPRVIFEGLAYKATLQYGSDNRFTFIEATLTNNSSSAEANFVNSILTLPIVRYMLGGKVIELFQATLRQDADGRFSIIGISEHPDIHP